MSENNFCYYRLKIDTTDAFNDQWKLPTPTSNYGIWAPKATEVFSKKWLSYTSSLGLDFNHILLFYCFL